jgi:radical SAM superfamily enzyme YgiQ (UPF0313 family)
MEPSNTVRLTQPADTARPARRIGTEPPAVRPTVCPTVCLVTALTIEDFLDPDMTVNSQPRPPQVGVLTLASILRDNGFGLQLINLDELYLSYLRRRSPEAAPEPAETPAFFLPFILQQIGTLCCDAVGLSSICSSYPLTLRLAQAIKRLSPDTPVILGGPQASVVDVATMEAFPCVDFVVRGEADRTFPALLERLFAGAGAAWEALPGITFRRGGAVVRNRNAPVIDDLDALPLPAFDLDTGFRDRSTGIHLEIGRGCPFACNFCSTNDFFRRNFRLKSPDRTLIEMQVIKQAYDVQYFSLVHDMYTVDRKRVVAFCETLLAAPERFRWGCSARTDCVDDELLRLMGEAGCTGIFFGIETGSQRLQRVINKKLDLDEARARIAQADRCGITMAIALIIGFPEETRDDLRDTVHFFIDAMRFDTAEPQISLLAPLAATPIYEEYRDRLLFDHIFSDMSHQGWVHDPADVALIKAYPDIFPNFYAVPAQWVDRAYLKEIKDFLNYLPQRFRWLAVALVQDSGDFLQVFDRWQAWRAANRAGWENDTGQVLYYAHANFRSDFLEFVRCCYLDEMATARPVIAALAQTEDMMAGLCDGSADPAHDLAHLNNSGVPYPACARRLDLEVDYNEMIECLRRRGDLAQVQRHKSTVVFLPTEPDPADRKSPHLVKLRVVQLSPLSAALFSLCDGRTPIGEIVRAFGERTTIDDISAEKVCLFGLLQLRKDGIIGVSATPLPVAADADPDEPLAGSWAPPLHQQANTQQPWPVG